MRRAVVLIAVVASSTVWVGTAFAQSPTIDPLRIGPDQLFRGLVNGSTGNALIQMDCPSPIAIGEMGHPLAGQDVSVELAPVSTTPVVGGFTGAASTIAAALELPAVTPGAAVATSSIPLAVFWLYGQLAPIPTTLTLPCYGKGAVVYNPVQGGPTARPDTVAVTFVSLPPASGS